MRSLPIDLAAAAAAMKAVITQPIPEPNRDAVHDDQIDLGMRDSEGLDRILDRRTSLEGIRKGNLAL
jgi:hypothetical protein